MLISLLKIFLKISLEKKRTRGYIRDVGTSEIIGGGSVLLLNKWIPRVWNAVSCDSFLTLCFKQLHGSDREEL